MAFGRLERRESPRPMGEINMTPLIDVMLVLLVIFMITAPLMSSSLRLDLPRSEAATPSDSPQFIAVSLNPQGELFLGEEAIEPGAFRTRIKQLGQARPELEVQLRADQAVPYGRVAELIGWIQDGGLHRIAFVAQAPSSDKP
ncbi:MAG TPA: biopolymer transporter ExbD [Burkholderiaceae bacterium]|nr:biopolymer transporter ExbD [Burkholderiaceae bacterium]